MTHGATLIRATSPHGAIVETEGQSLTIAKAVDGGNHFTIHEATKSNAIVAVIPVTWTLDVIHD